MKIDPGRTYCPVVPGGPRGTVPHPSLLDVAYFSEPGLSPPEQIKSQLSRGVEGGVEGGVEVKGVGVKVGLEVELE